MKPSPNSPHHQSSQVASWYSSANGSVCEAGRNTEVTKLSNSPWKNTKSCVATMQSNRNETSVRAAGMHRSSGFATRSGKSSGTCSRSRGKRSSHDRMRADNTPNK